MDRYEHPNTLGQLPTVWVNWDQASAACQSQGKRLCKEPEWIRACAGELGRDFGYGEVQEPGRCNDAQEVGEHDTLAPIGRNPACQSAWGVHDLQGNVSEWVHQSWSDDPSYKVLRGGTLWTAIYGHGCYSRHAHEGAGPSHGDDGFRCCQ
jgi:formylglycine-generating enzyme required for sulfatase activity